ncbi:RagB/SusD family nutrient uptake outer membrane protein [Parapedobacter indicus]|uniref:Starch-binding associating with outer membrane n=1 Tax=Parapedobacter indicus TaxID=1477437 RepID=A0A1I3F6M9_9SPHI|nr:RagB/SusD family nutrient uptake outer membrane protein [Parapedobacter indicus]PPL03585.1 putative outer membrane starch-binding protein [Parapedobacter indicus]SFI06874.1 Starch-binding associating with outer membrane [Parapedobacter indicus]
MKIKHSYIFGMLAAALLSCNNEYLERYPIAELAPENYFRSAAELQNYTNAFYNRLPDALAIHYNNPNQADDEARNTLAAEIQGTRETPSSGGGWDWAELRRINFYLENSHNCADEAARLQYDGIARFFRAYFYFDKLVRFGDVPWYDSVLEIDDEGLTKARDSRKVVFANMLEDIDFAIANCQEPKSGQLITKWTALALKSRMCLFEGTFRKYHGLGDAEEILQQCVAASEALINSGTYTIYTSDPNTAYQELFIAEDAITSEMILARQYDASVPFVHSANFYILSASYGRPGLQKSVVNSYLMKDGSRFTDIPGYGTMQFFEETQNRDPRMAQTIRTPGYKRIGRNEVSVPDFATSVTGYQYVKYVLAPAFDSGQSTNDMPIFRYAEVLLNFAEAKAELGTITQTDIDKSIKLLRDRVGMPNLDVAAVNANPDPYLLQEYPHVETGTNTGVLLEIRRERRIELVKEGHRYRDLMRWKEGARLAKPFYGMYFPGAGEYDLDHDGTIDLVIYQGQAPAAVPGRQYQRLGELVLENGENGGRIVNMPDIIKRWDEDKDYFYPIPTQELQLNTNLQQNPGWEDTGS